VQAGYLEFPANLGIELMGQGALDQGHSEPAPYWRLNRRAAALCPGRRQDLVVPAAGDSPPDFEAPETVESAPYLAALLASSWTAIANASPAFGASATSGPAMTRLPFGTPRKRVSTRSA